MNNLIISSKGINLGIGLRWCKSVGKSQISQGEYYQNIKGPELNGGL